MMLKIGDKVVMNDKYRVAEKNKGVVFTVKSEPWNCGGTEVVLLDNYSGGYAVDGLSLAKEDKMTPQEAIETLRTSIHISGKCNEVCKELEARQMAVSALEKEIAKKPCYEGDGYDDKGNLIYDTAYCPNCNKEFEVYYYSGKRCDDCGQLLDWSDIND